MNKDKYLKLWIFLILLMVCIGKQAVAQTNTVSSTSSTVSGTTTVDRTPSTASAPSVVINNQDVCSVASSMAIQSQILGIAGGTTSRDLNCERLKLAKTIYDMGMKVAAVSIMCQDARVFNAMEMAGTPCPYLGKIGKEAQKGWDENPDLKPITEQEQSNNDQLKGAATGIGIAGLLFLLL